MHGRTQILAACAACLLGAAAAVASNDLGGARVAALAPESSALLARAVADPDPSAGAKLAARLSADQIAAAMYRGTRAERSAAIDAARHLEDPWPVLPFLAAFLRAPERDAASRAADSLLAALERIAARPDRPPELVPKQAEQLARALLAAAEDDVLDIDLRAVALASARLVGRVSATRPFAPPALFEDPEPAVALAAVALAEPPLSDDELEELARIAGSGADPIVRGRAVGALCENALAHGVAKPSPDLERLIRGVFDKAAPGASLLPALACVGRFSADARSQLVDLALAHPDPAVRRFWESGSQ